MTKEDLQRALNHIIQIIQMQSWASSWRDRDEELIKSLYQVRVRLERRLSLLVSLGQ